jgi:hypothetical protein
MYLRTVKVRSTSGALNEYVRVVEAYREGGKVKQRVVADRGRKDLLVEILPGLQRLLGGDTGQEETPPADPEVVDASTWGPVLALRALFDQLSLWSILDDSLGKAKGVPFADRTFVLVANRLIAPASDITSTYFEGTGPVDFAKHGYSRDGKPHNVQVIVGVVMVAGWPIAHHVWAGNRIDHGTVQDVVGDLHRRFEFKRLVFVGDRGMVTEANLESLTKEGQGFLVGLKRRRNEKLDRWLAAIDESRWIDGPVGINARERKTNPPRTRAQEVPSGVPGMRVIVIDSDERRTYEQAMRQQAMERARGKLEALKQRVASGDLKKPEKIGAAAERIMQRYHGYRYYAWELRRGAFEFFESETHLEREERIEGRYVIATSEQDLDVSDAVAMYKDLTDVEQGFRQLKDVLALRPIYHQIENRFRAHIFVAALALLVQRLLDRRLEGAAVDLSPARAMQALSTVRLVTFRLGSQPERRGISGGSPEARRVLKALKLVDLHPPSPPEGEKTVM